jgi:hypothetical protein
MKIHHIGLLVENIETYLESSFWSLQSDVVFDPVQKCRLALVCIDDDDSHLVELIEPAGEDSPVHLALQKNHRQHHICFEARTCREVDEFIRSYRLLPVSRWEPAPLFQGRLIRFAYTRNRELLEFLTSERR